MNLAFYVSGKAGRLQYLINQQSKVVDSIKLVISDAGFMALEEKVKQLNINYYSFEYNKELPKAHENERLSNFILNSFKENEIDYCFCFGVHILTGDLLIEYKDRIINFHPSLLPLFPGLNAIDQAMQDPNVNILGNTAHFINEKIDAGKILVQNAFSKSFYLQHGYEGILNSQIQLMELIFKNLLTRSIYIMDDLVYLLESSSDEKQEMIFNYE